MSGSKDTDEVRRLLLKHVPEVKNGTVEIMGIARDPGRLSLIAVLAIDPAVDAIGACTGSRGSVIKPVVHSLPGDQLRIVRWSESPRDFIVNLMSPRKVKKVTFDDASRQATIIASKYTQPAPRLERDLDLKLASEMSGWDLRLVED